MLKVTRQCMLTGVLLWGVSGAASAFLVTGDILQINPAVGQTTTFAQGQAGASVTFNIDVVGLGNEGYTLSAYDFFIAYDPSVLQLAVGGFSGFRTSLGNGFPEVVNEGPDGPFNSSFLYTDDNALFGPYSGPSAGTPIPGVNGPYHEGSLKFTQGVLSLDMDNAALDLLQDDNYFNLFSLTFNVLTGTAGTSPIFVVDDSRYDGFESPDGPTDQGEYDYKDGNFAFTHLDNMYLGTRGSQVTITPSGVPVPPTLALLLLGGLGLRIGASRRGR